MTKNYKKRSILIIDYHIPSSKQIVKSIGIVFKISELMLTLVHNFSGTGRRPIDITKIPLKNILKSEEIEPKEINSLGDFNTSS